MLLNTLELNNWQSYRGSKNKFDFTGPDSTRNSSIILGRNAQGKSAFFEAIQFLFYGKEAVVDRDSDLNPKRRKPLVHERKDAYPLMCWEAWRDGDLSFGIKASISLKGQDYLIERRFSSKKKNPEESNLKEEFYILKSSNKKKEVNPEEFINSLLPKGITKFFTIDGELMTEYRKLFSNQRAGLAQDLERILRMGILDAAIYQTNSVMRGLETDKRRAEAELIRDKDKKKEIKNLDKDIDNAAEKFGKSEKKIEKLKGQYDEVVAWMNSEGNMKAHLDKLEKIEDDEEGAKDQIETLKEKRGKQFANGWKQVIKQKVKDSLETQQNILDRQRENKGQADELNSQMKSNKNLLAGDPCFSCGQKKADLSPTERVNINDTVGTLQLQIDSLIKASQSPDAFPVMDRINLFNRLITDIPFAQTKEISNQIATLEIKLVSLETDRKATLKRVDEDALETLRDEKVRMSTISAKLGEERDMLEIHRRAEEVAIQRRKIRGGKTTKSESSTDLKKLRKKIAIADLLAKLCAEAKDPFRNNTRESVEKIAERTYLELIQEDHDRLEFDTEFRVSVYEKNGDTVALTAGQKALATYCILEALSQVSALSFPLIVDSPGQGVDKEYIAAIFSHFLSFSERQVIVIPTTSEIDAPNMVDKYGPSVASIYEVTRARGTRETKISEVHRRKK